MTAQAERLIFYRADKTVTNLLREGFTDVEVVADAAGQPVKYGVSQSQISNIKRGTKWR